MTLEPSMLAVEERLQRLASSMPAPDVDAGWATLSAMLEPPGATVIPLRRKTPRFRPIALAAAAAILVAGSAFAAVTHGSSPIAPASPIELPGLAVAGPHLHAPFSGPPGAPSQDGDAQRPGGSTTGAPTATGGNDGSSSARDGHTKPQDDPNDLDQGTGNDGPHNDKGGGNNGIEGSQRQRGQGHGDGGGPPGQSKAKDTGTTQGAAHSQAADHVH